MGCLAYMTGRPGDPLCAGSGLNDIMEGIFGAIGAMATLEQRAVTGKGQAVQTALFKKMFLVARHMMQFAVTNQSALPMPSRLSAWGIYDDLTVRDGEQFFLAVVSDTQWAQSCRAFALIHWQSDARLTRNHDRVRASGSCPRCASTWPTSAQPNLVPCLRRMAYTLTPITRPKDLFDDGLAEIQAFVPNSPDQIE